MKPYDLIIIGSGPGGYVAAIRARQLGLRTALIERQHLGGVCLNWGCIPTKALLQSAELYTRMRAAEDFGLKIGDIKVDWARVVGRSRDIAAQLGRGVAHLMKKNGVDVIHGSATLKGPTTVQVQHEDKVELFSAPAIILATGASPRRLADVPESEHIWTSTEAMQAAQCPKSLMIVGSGAIGVEFASFYNAFGSAVTILEREDRILPHEDIDVARAIQSAFEKRGIRVVTGAHVGQVVPGARDVTVTYEQSGQSTSVQADKILLALGVTPNTQGLGLETTAVMLERGHIAVNDYGQTTEPSIYAIGDVARVPWLAHKASHEGVQVVDAIVRGPQAVHPFTLEDVPSGIYCTPQVGRIGLTEAEAQARGSVKVGRFPYAANGKALAMGDAEGFVKVIFDAETGALLGAHVVGAEATEVIQNAVIARALETTDAALEEMIFPHPTLSEMFHEAVLDAGGRALHI